MKKNFTFYFAVSLLLSAFCFLPSSGALAQNSFPTSNAIILVEDTVITHTIMASRIGSGGIEPEGPITVPHGANQIFKIINATGWQELVHLWIDGKDELWNNTMHGQGFYVYEFQNVTTDHTIVAEFRNVGINENKHSDLLIYPNPTNGELRITNYELRITNYELRITNYELRITDITGKIVFTQKLQEDTEYNIDISHLQSGMYFLKVDNQVFKIIKN